MNPKKEAEGKTKIVWPTSDESVVLIENKDDITAGDGARHDIIEHKGALATETTCNCFALLSRKGVPTHFLEKESEKRFLARKVTMIPLELVCRRIAAGSYLERYPEISEGTIFEPLIFEAFYKDDELHDPLMIWSERWRCFELHHAKKPLGRGYLLNLNLGSLLNLKGNPFGKQGLAELGEITRSTFSILETAWKELWNVVLVDLKIECGWTSVGSIVVADVVDNDSWMIWPGGDKSQMKDKQVYRDLGKTTAEALGAIKENYAWVAEATQKFVHF